MKRDQAGAYTGLAVGGCEYKGGRSEEGGGQICSKIIYFPVRPSGSPPRWKL